MSTQVEPGRAQKLLHRVLVGAGGLALTAGMFLVLPIIQAIGKPPAADLLVRQLDTGDIDPPEAPPEPEPEQEPEPEEKPPELQEPAQPLDLSQLELSLNPGGFGSGWGSGNFGMKLDTMLAVSESTDELFSLADLDQKPRAVYRENPKLTPELRKKAPATVYVLCVVDQRGRVENPIVQKSRAADAGFEQSALAAVKNWRFEPGKRKGEPVRFRIRIPITFPASR